MYPSDKLRTKLGDGKIGFAYWQKYPDTPFFKSRNLAGKPHYGQDIVPLDELVKEDGGKFYLTEDIPVIAAVDGHISANYLSNSYGNIIKQTSTSSDKGREHRYAHLKKTYVEVGQLVKKGEIIGMIGSTGSSNYPHLHYETRKWKQDRLVPFNPEPYLT